MKEYIYKNIWSACEERCSAPARRIKILRFLLWPAAVYYLLMCFAYLFAMILALRYEGVTFVSNGQAVNLFVVMLISVAAELSGVICSFRKAHRCGVFLSAINSLLFPFALWSVSINTAFKVHHLISMLLMLAVQLALLIPAEIRRKHIRGLYNKTVSETLAAHSRPGGLLSTEETEQILQSYTPGTIASLKPPKRSQKSRQRKRSQGGHGSV